MALDRMTQMYAGAELIAIAPPAAPVPQIAGLFEVGHDALDGALGNANLRGHIAQPHTRLPGQTEQDVPVIA